MQALWGINWILGSLCLFFWSVMNFIKKPFLNDAPLCRWEIWFRVLLISSQGILETTGAAGMNGLVYDIVLYISTFKMLTRIELNFSSDLRHFKLINYIHPNSYCKYATFSPSIDPHVHIAFYRVCSALRREVLFQ